MKSNRRDFLKLTGLAGPGVTGAGMTAGCVPESLEVKSNLDLILTQSGKKYFHRFNMSGYAASELDVVRIGNRSNSIDVPDFTCGSWKINKPLMDIDLKRGRTTSLI